MIKMSQEHEECQRYHQKNGARKQKDGGTSEGAQDGHEQRKRREGVSAYVGSNNTACFHFRQTVTDCTPREREREGKRERERVHYLKQTP